MMEKKMKALMINSSIPQEINVGMSRITKFFLHESFGGFLYAIEQKGDDGKASLLHKVKLNGILHECFRVIPRVVCANGLFCLWGASPERAAIYNPYTREVRFLPRYNDDFYISDYLYYSLGFEPEEKKYKVLWTTGNGYFVRNWILTLGTDESWKEINSNPPFIFGGPGECINGVLYWFNFRSEGSIAAFDIKSENFKSVALWNASRHMMDNYKMVEVKGKLAIMDCEEWMSGYIKLWTLEDTRQAEWESRIIRFPLQLNNIDDRMTSFNYCQICTSCDGEILFIVKIKSDAITCLCYDVMKKSWREFEIEGIPVENISTVYI